MSSTAKPFMHGPQPSRPPAQRNFGCRVRKCASVRVGDKVILEPCRRRSRHSISKAFWANIDALGGEDLFRDWTPRGSAGGAGSAQVPRSMICLDAQRRHQPHQSQRSAGSRSFSRINWRSGRASPCQRFACSSCAMATPRATAVVVRAATRKICFPEA